MNLLRQELNWASQQLAQNGNFSAQAEAEQILTHLLNCQRIDLYLNDDLFDRLDPQVFRRLVEQRIERIPLQYLTKESYFYGFPLKVQPGVFIPRPESEVLIQQVLDLFRDNAGVYRDTPLHFLDLGTGSGNIAIALTKILSYCKISAIEISPVALETAKENACRHGVERRINFIQEDWAFYLNRLEDRAEGIIANPPYIPSGEIPRLDLEVQMEPRQALDGGADGLDWIRILLEQAGRALKREGYLVFEIGKDQGQAVKEIARRQGWKEFGAANDLNGIERVFWTRKTRV